MGIFAVYIFSYPLAATTLSFSLSPKEQMNKILRSIRRWTSSFIIHNKIFIIFPIVRYGLECKQAFFGQVVNKQQ